MKFWHQKQEKSKKVNIIQVIVNGLLKRNQDMKNSEKWIRDKRYDDNFPIKVINFKFAIWSLIYN